MAIELRPLRVPDDYVGLAALLNTFWSEPTSARRLEEDDANLYEVGDTFKDANGQLGGYDRTRWVAVEDGRIVGYVWSWRAPWTEPGYLNNTIVVERACRGRGIGEKLLRHLVQWGEGLGAAKLVTELWDDDPASRRFAENRGFAMERHAFQSMLMLADAKPDVLEETALFAALEREGIRFSTLAEEGHSEENERKLYEIYLETMADIPGFTGEVPVVDEWRKWHLQVDGFASEQVLLAIVGDRFVGASNLPHNKMTNGMYHEYTGVLRDYRGRGIARALKIRAIQLAKRRGAVYLKTDNDSLNAAILRLNRSLGYVPQRGSYRLSASLQAVKDALASV